MVRNRGIFNFSANLEVKKNAPLDSRVVVDTLIELTETSTWADSDNKVWLYDGIVKMQLILQYLVLIMMRLQPLQHILTLIIGLQQMLQLLRQTLQIIYSQQVLRQLYRLIKVEFLKKIQIS